MYENSLRERIVGFSKFINDTSNTEAQKYNIHISEKEIDSWLNTASGGMTLQMEVNLSLFNSQVKSSDDKDIFTRDDAIKGIIWELES